MNYQPLDDLLFKWKREAKTKKMYRAMLTNPLEQYKLGEQIIQEVECAVELIDAIQKIKREEEGKINLLLTEEEVKSISKGLFTLYRDMSMLYGNHTQEELFVLYRKILGALHSPVDTSQKESRAGEQDKNPYNRGWYNSWRYGFWKLKMVD